MKVNPTDHVLHLSFDDEAYGRADVFCGEFNKRQVANKTYKPIDFSITKLPFKDKTFDLVYCTNTLAYSHQPEAIVDEIKRIGRKAHIRERSEFAEMIFGWDNTKWIVDVENRELIIKSKNDLKIGMFGPFFHNLYATDPVFFDYISKVPGLMSIAVDWNEEDDITEEIEEEIEEFVVPETDKKEGEEKMFDEVKIDEEEGSLPNVTITETKKVKKKIKIVKSIFRPCQCEIFDDIRIVLGEITQQIDVRHLKNQNLK